jgi:hypothetical protein
MYILMDNTKMQNILFSTLSASYQFLRNDLGILALATGLPVTEIIN